MNDEERIHYLLQSVRKMRVARTWERDDDWKKHVIADGESAERYLTALGIPIPEWPLPEPLQPSPYINPPGYDEQLHVAAKLRKSKERSTSATTNHHPDRG